MHSSGYETLRNHVYLMCHYQKIIYKYYITSRAKFGAHDKQVILKSSNYRQNNNLKAFVALILSNISFL